MKMMKLNKYGILLISASLLLQYNSTFAQENAAGKPVIKLHYFNNNNRVQYFILESQLKKNKNFTPQANKAYDLYFVTDDGEETLVSKMKTNERGKAKALIPEKLVQMWDTASTHTFMVKAGEEEVVSDFVITKAKITIDTASTDGVRSITVAVMKNENNEWVPSPDVEMIVGVQRNAGSILSAGDQDTYTTDSSGLVTVDLLKEGLPGDAKGNFVLAARVDDNDEFGNLLAEKTVPWGTVSKINTTFFNQRALWTTRFRTPYWLLVMAYSIIIGVWGTLIYLVVQLFKIKKLGTLVTSKSPPASSDKT
jgi:hypothetical protein